MRMIAVSCPYNSPPTIFIIFSTLHLSSGFPINSIFTSEERLFTHKRPSHRVFRKEVKGDRKNIYL